MIDAAIVGLGWWGRKILATLAGSQKIRIVAGIDVAPDAARDLVGARGVRFSTRLSDALEDTSIDAFILATPHSLHEEQVLAVVASGKQVFCEKPLALTADGARRMLDACADAGCILGIGHERRYERHFEEIERRIAEGSLGTLLHAEANFSHDKLKALPADNWRGQAKDAPAAGMTGVGIHLTDALTNLLGPVEEVFARTARRVLDIPTGDIVSADLRFESGVTASLAAMLATPFYGRFTVFGERGWLEARDDAHVEEGGASHLVACDAESRRTEITYGPFDAVRANFEAWADAVAGGAPYRFHPEQMFHNVATLEAIVRSTITGRPEPVEARL